MTWDTLSADVEAGRFRAKCDNVLVKVEQQQGDTRAGSLIHVPPTLLGSARNDKGRTRRDVARGLLARVVAVGPGHYPEVRTMPRRELRGKTEEETSPTIRRKFIPTVVRPGELVVLASQVSGDVWPLSSGEHRMVREAEIEAVIEEDGAA